MNLAVATNQDKTKAVIESLILKRKEEIHEINDLKFINIKKIIENKSFDLNNHYDIIFLDIDEDKNIIFPEILSKTSFSGSLVFMSGDFKKVMKCFKYGAKYFLTLPINAVELNKCINTVISQQSIKKYLIRLGDIEYVLTDNDIIYVESDNSACRYNLKNNTDIKSYHTLREIAQFLNSDVFLRTHKSYIVNMNYIKDVTPKNFQLIDGEYIPIRKRGGKKVRDAYLEFRKKRDNLMEL